jgi:glycosyltransferase involved in cell wall biosynthesis
MVGSCRPTSPLESTSDRARKELLRGIVLNSVGLAEIGQAVKPGESLKIGILTHIQHPIREPFAGGLEAFTHDVTLNLRQRGHDVTLFAHPDSAQELQVVPMSAAGSYRSDVAKHDHDTLSAAYIAEHHAYQDCLQKIDDFEFDVVFNNSLHYVPITFAGMIDTPVLTVLHTPPFFEMINAMAALQKRGGGNYCTVSRANAASWAELAPHCHVIPNGIDLHAWCPTDDAIGEHALWTGRLVPDKGLHLAMDAARLAGIPLRIAGRILDQTYFDKQIAPRLNHQAIYLGHLPRTALINEVSRASVSLVTPCWDEPFGLVVAESLASGTPVAGFARGAIPELLTPETGALAPPGDVNRLANALLDARKLSREACRSHALANWGVDRMISRYEGLLGDIAARASTYA